MNIPDYRCTVCKNSCPREDLTVKKTVFLEMGAGARTIKSRVLEWLCPRCRSLDPEFNMEARIGA